MKRRRILTVVGTAALATAAGCSSDDSPSSDEDDRSYETVSYDGEAIPLAPAEDVHGWFEADDAEFVDTRGVSQYDAGHVPGAVLSPSAVKTGADPTGEWSRDTRVVTYCDCPHTLAGQRAAQLKAAGFEDVYAIDEGFQGWEEAGYPVATNDSDATVETYEIAGESDPKNEGEYVHVSTASEDSYEVAVIEADGSYETEIRFPDVSEETTLVVEAPDYTVEGSLEELTDGVLTAEDASS